MLVWGCYDTKGNKSFESDFIWKWSFIMDLYHSFNALLCSYFILIFIFSFLYMFTFLFCSVWSSKNSFTNISPLYFQWYLLCIWLCAKSEEIMSSKTQSQFRRNPCFTEREKKIATVKCEKYFSNFNVHQNQLGILLKIDSDSVNLGWSLWFFISNKLPADDASCLWSMLWVENQ